MLPYDMMSDRDALNAYVDGELDAAHAAEIAARIARNPALAREAAALMQLKASAAAAYDTASFVPDLGDPRPARRRKQWRHALVAAAALVLLLGAGIGVQYDATPRTPGWLNAAAAQHAAMAAAPARATLHLAGIADIAGFHPYIPDLLPARLRPVASEPFRPDEAVAPIGLALHYRGTRGCKLTYIAFALDESDYGRVPDEALTPVGDTRIKGYSWRIGDIGYLLIARGMDPARLATLASTVHAASRKYRPLDESARTRLAESRANSRSCAA